jgi:hypothetical protein
MDTPLYILIFGRSGTGETVAVAFDGSLEDSLAVRAVGELSISLKGDAPFFAKGCVSPAAASRLPDLTILAT